MGGRRSRARLEGTLQGVKAVPRGLTPTGTVPQIATSAPTAHTSHKLRHTTLTLGDREVAQRSTLLFRPTRVQDHTTRGPGDTHGLAHSPPVPHAPTPHSPTPSPHTAPALASDRHGHLRRPPGDPPRTVEFGGGGRAGLRVPRRTAVCAAKCRLCTERRAAEPERRLSPQTLRPHPAAASISRSHRNPSAAARIRRPLIRTGGSKENSQSLTPPTPPPIAPQIRRNDGVAVRRAPTRGSLPRAFRRLRILFRQPLSLRPPPTAPPALAAPSKPFCLAHPSEVVYTARDIYLDLDSQQVGAGGS